MPREVGTTTDSCAVKNCHSGIDHPSIRRLQMIFKKAAELPAIRYSTKKRNCPFNHTGNVYEMAVYSVILLNYTVDAKVQNKHILKKRLPRIVCIRVDVHELPPYNIVKCSQSVLVSSS